MAAVLDILQAQHPLDRARAACLRGDPDESERLLRIVLKNGEDQRATFNMGWHHMRHGHLLEGMKCLAVGRWLNVFGSPPLGAGKPIWNGEPLAGKILLLHGEGGFGDQIINLRFIDNFHQLGAKVIVSCDPLLVPLVRTIPNVHAIVTMGHAAGVDHDYWVPAMSAPLVLALQYTSLSGKPYIPRPEPMELPGRFKVGLRWFGNPKFEDEQHRCFPKRLMSALAATEGASFYSLQLPAIEDMPPGVTDLSPFLNNWLTTAQFIAGLDLVITSCTATAHLAGAMGIPTWVIVPVMPYYIWSEPGVRSSWYDSVRLYRQAKYGEWESVFESIQNALSDCVSIDMKARVA